MNNEPIEASRPAAVGTYNTRVQRTRESVRSAAYARPNRLLSVIRVGHMDPLEKRSTYLYVETPP